MKWFAAGHSLLHTRSAAAAGAPLLHTELARLSTNHTLSHAQQGITLQPHSVVNAAAQTLNSKALHRMHAQDCGCSHVDCQAVPLEAQRAGNVLWHHLRALLPFLGCATAAAHKHTQAPGLREVAGSHEEVCPDVCNSNVPAARPLCVLYPEVYAVAAQQEQLWRRVIRFGTSERTPSCQLQAAPAELRHAVQLPQPAMR